MLFKFVGNCHNINLIINNPRESFESLKRLLSEAAMDGLVWSSLESLLTCRDY